MVDMPMQHQIMGYDRTSAMFSPDGHLLQVEYAEKTVKLGSASLGMMCMDGIIIVADKRIRDVLIHSGSTSKIYEVDSHIGVTAAGILSDARVLIEKSQLQAQQHRATYDSAIDTESVVKEIANTKQFFSQYSGVRPFGVSLLFAGVNPNNSPRLFITDVTGNYFAYKATAIGENDDKLKELLRKDYKESLDTQAGIKLALNIFKKVLGKNFDISRFEAVYITKKDKKFIRIIGDQLRKYIK